MLIGERVKEARLNKNYSQEKLGQLLGVTKVSICGYEGGTRTPTMQNFLDLVEILDVTPNYLLGRDMDVVMEENESYRTSIAKEDLIFIKELKKHRELYNQICKDPKRYVERIIHLLNK